MIFTSTGYADYQGSGFFISSDGLAVSNYHVFEGTGMGLEAIKLVDDRRFKIKEVIKNEQSVPNAAGTGDPSPSTAKAKSVTLLPK